MFHYMFASRQTFLHIQLIHLELINLKPDFTRKMCKYFICTIADKS